MVRKPAGRDSQIINFGGCKSSHLKISRYWLSCVYNGVSGSVTSIKNISESILKTREIVNGILAKHTGRDIEEINAATNFDNFMNAEEAIKFGLCDVITERINVTEI